MNNQKLRCDPLNHRADKFPYHQCKSSHQLQREITSSKSEPNLRNAGRKPVIRTGQNFESELARTLWSWGRVLNLQMEQNQEIGAELRRNLKSLGKKIDHVIELLKQTEKKAVNSN